MFLVVLRLPKNGNLTDNRLKPPIQEFIKDKYKFYLSLSNNVIGYIIPKSELDTGKPYLYKDVRDTYGEENSLGPETGQLIYNSLKEVIKNLNWLTIKIGLELQASYRKTFFI